MKELLLCNIGKNNLGIGCFISLAVIKFCDKNNLEGKRVYLTYSSRLQLITVTTSRHKLEATSNLRAEREIMHTCLVLSYLSLLLHNPSPKLESTNAHIQYESPNIN